MRGSYESYTDWLFSAMRAGGARLVARTVARTSGEIARVLSGLAIPPGVAGAGLIGGVALVLVLTLLAIGAHVFWKRAQATIAFLALYTLIILIWPFESGR